MIASAWAVDWLRVGGIRGTMASRRLGLKRHRSQRDRLVAAGRLKHCVLRLSLQPFLRLDIDIPIFIFCVQFWKAVSSMIDCERGDFVDEPNPISPQGLCLTVPTGDQ